MLEALERLQREGHLADVDVHFARFVARLAGSEAPELLLGACLASHWTGEGHVCLDLAEAAGRPVFNDGEESARLTAPAFGEWVARLEASPVVGEPGQYRPLILDERGRLYLYRYWAYETQVAEGLLARAREPVAGVDEARLREGLARLFPATQPGGETDWQRVAAATAVLRRLCVISGGPGTGKTTTVTRILALLAEHLPDAPPRVALAAPTGKVAARMQETLRAAKATLDVAPAVRDAIPSEAATLHRLLGARPHSVYFRHNRDNPLPLDVVVVDEASMVDVALLAKLVHALPPSARLVLLGDKDQLASVEAGAVLGDVCADVPGPSEALRARLEAVTGETLPSSGTSASPLRDSVVVLRRNYRFGRESGIARLAHAVAGGDAAGAVELLEGGTHDDVAWRPIGDSGELARSLEPVAVSAFGPYLEAVRSGESPVKVLEAFHRFRVLAALRRGPFGVETLNALIEEALRAHRSVRTRTVWYPGRPVMVLENDYHLGLYNGDVGVALPDPDSEGKLRVAFETSDGELRRFAPARLPHHETVFAMTVHKSQGSEFDDVLLVLPPEDARVLTRELLYTGITRARRRIELSGSMPAVRAGVARRVQRASGLYERLWGSVP